MSLTKKQQEYLDQANENLHNLYLDLEETEKMNTEKQNNAYWVACANMDLENVK